MITKKKSDISSCRLLDGVKCIFSSICSEKYMEGDYNTLEITKFNSMCIFKYNLNMKRYISERVKAVRKHTM